MTGVVGGKVRIPSRQHVLRKCFGPSSHPCCQGVTHRAISKGSVGAPDPSRRPIRAGWKPPRPLSQNEGQGVRPLYLGTSGSELRGRSPSPRCIIDDGVYMYVGIRLWFWSWCLKIHRSQFLEISPLGQGNIPENFPISNVSTSFSKSSFEPPYLLAL